MTPRPPRVRERRCLLCNPQETTLPPSAADRAESPMQREIRCLRGQPASAALAKARSQRRLDGPGHVRPVALFALVAPDKWVVDAGGIRGFQQFLECALDRLALADAVGGAVLGEVLLNAIWKPYGKSHGWSKCNTIQVELYYNRRYAASLSFMARRFCHRGIRASRSPKATSPGISPASLLGVPVRAAPCPW